MTDWNLEQPGSRFTGRPAIAIVAGEAFTIRRERGETAVGETAAMALVGERSLEDHVALGRPIVVDGSIGRGASSWIPVIEWSLEVIGTAMAGNAAWDGTKWAARVFRERVDSARRRNPILVSRGAAALLAVDHVSDHVGALGPLSVESVLEPSAFNGDPPTELSYTGIEPWLVCVSDESKGHRYVVAVQADGTVIGTIAVPVDDLQRMFSEFPSGRSRTP